MTVRAHVEYDWQMHGVRVVISEASEQGSRTMTWPRFPMRVFVPRDSTSPKMEIEHSDADEWLRLNEDEARALYEGLASYFGGVGHDTRALRRDYDAERKRVDGLIAHLLREVKA